MVNDRFFEYYKAQEIVPQEEWDDFVDVLRQHLPTTFRVTGSRQYVLAFEISLFSSIWWSYQGSERPQRAYKRNACPFVEQCHIWGSKNSTPCPDSLVNAFSLKDYLCLALFVKVSWWFGMAVQCSQKGAEEISWVQKVSLLSRLWDGSSTSYRV